MDVNSDRKFYEDMLVRVGFGFDVHPLEEGAPLWLGGILIPSDRGATGHSDADTLLHAICDALLGTINAGDIGTHFSDRDPKWKGADSTLFLKKVVEMVTGAGYRINNIDTTIVLEAPKIAPFIPDIKQKLAEVMEIREDQISVKATTTEKLGFTGRREGVSAYCTALVRYARPT
ncbi:MAG: 2-C-methyl-D-erythritol 2,4-cyclodiphosphate synthase [Bacteroidales bacterium]